MAYRLRNRADKLLARLDKQYGKDSSGNPLNALIYVPTGTTTDEFGDVVVAYDDPIEAIVRPAELTVIEMANLQAQIGQISAVWKMRSHYLSHVEADYIMTVGAFDYQVVDGGAILDALQLEWTIATRRRRS